MAEAGGRPPMTPKALYAGCKRLRPSIREAQRTIRDGVKDVFLGIGLHEPSAPLAGLLSEEVIRDDA